MGPEDFDRPLHMVLGLPFDAICMRDVVERLRALPASRDRCFISTPNLNFVIAAQSDPAFRQSVFDSDLSLADGMPIVWIARLLGIPLPERVPGSGLIDALRAKPEGSGEPIRVFFFGGEPGFAEKACRVLKRENGGRVCVGAIDPGYGSAEALSQPAYIDAINAAGPDFLIVSLGAKKGQEWILANRGRLNAPAVSHLGAVIKFVAGDVARAPGLLQRLGMEWLWRIREEPGLWLRYLRDGLAFLKLLATAVLPLALWIRISRLRGRTVPGDAVIEAHGQTAVRTVRLGPCLSAETIDAVRDAFTDLAAAEGVVEIDFTAVRYLDSAFLGQLFVLQALSRSRPFDLRIRNVPRRVRRAIGWYLCDFILDRKGTAGGPETRVISARSRQ